MTITRNQGTTEAYSVSTDPYWLVETKQGDTHILTLHWYEKDIHNPELGIPVVETKHRETITARVSASMKQHPWSIYKDLT